MIEYDDPQGFTCRCGCDKFDCRAEVSGFVGATVFVDDSGELEVYDHEDNGALSFDDFEGPFVCSECGAKYDEIPPDGWTGWDPSEMRLSPKQRLAKGERMLSPEMVQP